VCTLIDVNEAELIQKLLAKSEIECAVRDEYQAGFSGVFRIGVIVWERDAKRAADVIKKSTATQDVTIVVVE